MPTDFADIEAFYQSRQGGLARRLIGHQLRQLWPDLHGRSVLGLGYAVPFLPVLDAAERAFAFLPERDGAANRRPPAEAAGRAALVREDDLPLPDRSVDRVLLVHAIECSPNPARLLREVWRVLADGGRLIAVVPNRRGLWCLSEGTPFGHGQPYSAGQLGRRLDGHLFERRAERGALYMPPTRSRLLLRLAVPVERVGLSLAPNLAGVVLVEAEKRIYVGTPLPVREGAAVRARRYVAVPRSLAAAREPGRAPEDDLPRAA
jgi:SAM-dependent methyltransferase